MVFSFLFQRQCMQPLSTVTAEAYVVKDMTILCSRNTTDIVFTWNTINMMFPSLWHKPFNSVSRHKTHLCYMRWFLCCFFGMARNTLSRICALHHGRIYFCSISWSFGNMNGASKDASYDVMCHFKHNTEFLSKRKLSFAWLHLDVMRVWYFRITQYFPGMVNAITHWLSLVKFPPIQNLTKWTQNCNMFLSIAVQNGRRSRWYDNEKYYFVPGTNPPNVTQLRGKN